MNSPVLGQFLDVGGAVHPQFGHRYHTIILKPVFLEVILLMITIRLE